MTRRDRAALSLAYECVRGGGPGCVNAAARVLEAPLFFRPYGVVTPSDEILCAMRDGRMWKTRLENRLLRARLALLLRVLLRERVPGPFHAGECRGRVVHELVEDETPRWLLGASVTVYMRLVPVCVACRKKNPSTTLRYTALWEQAGRSGT